MKKVKISEAVKNGLVKNQGSYIDKAVSTDLNILLDYGDYLIGESSNRPILENGILCVRPFGTLSLGLRIIQYFYAYSGRVFTRVKYISNTFTGWKEM